MARAVATSQQSERRRFPGHPSVRGAPPSHVAQRLCTERGDAQNLLSGTSSIEGSWNDVLHDGTRMHESLNQLS